MKKLKRLLIAVVIVAFVLVALFYTLTVIFTESLYTSRGTFSYYVTIPKEIRNFPEIGIIGEPKFFYGCGDGPKPPIQEIQYKSSAHSETILEKTDNFLKSKGYVLSEKNEKASFCDEGMIYKKHHSIIEVCIVSDNGSQYRVQVSKFY